MIVFVQPQYSKQELNADSNYVVCTALINGIHSIRPDWHFVMVWPDAKSGFKYDEDGFFRCSYVTRVPQRISTRRSCNAVTFDGNWYDALMRRYGFDVCWCNLPEIAGQIRNAGRTTREPISKTSIVSAHNYVMHDSLPYEYMEHIALAELAGSLCSDVDVFNSDHCLGMFRDNVARYLNEDQGKRLEASSVRIDYGTLEDSLKIEDRESNDVPVIAYNHRLLGHKNWRTTVKVLDELYREGVKFKFRFLNNTAERSGGLRGYPWVEIVLSRTRDEYIKNLRGCDLNTINSDHETFCIAGAESMALGQPFIAPNGVTFPEITGAESNGYPYLFDTVAEQKNMLRELLTDPAKRAHWGSVASEHVRKNYTQSLWAKRHVDLFEQYAPSKFDVGMSDKALAKIREAVKVNAGKTTAEMYSWLSSKDGHVDGKHTFGTQTMTLTKLIRVLRRVGARVTMKGGRQMVEGIS